MKFILLSAIIIIQLKIHYILDKTIVMSWIRNNSIDFEYFALAISFLRNEP